MLEINQEVWLINNNRVENMFVVGFEIKRLLYHFSETIGIDDNYVYLASSYQLKKVEENKNNNSECKFEETPLKVMRSKVFLTKEELIKQL